MKIAIISKSNKLGGGASRVAEDLARWLNESGHIAHHYHKNGIQNIWERKLYMPGQPIFSKIYGLFRKLGIYAFFPIELPRLLIALYVEKYDVMHFHDITSSISPFTIKILSKYVPIIWTFHDCSPFTGGCLYPMDCDKYKKNCRKCPQVGTWPLDLYVDNVYIDKIVKNIVLKSSNFNIIAPSKWVAKKAYSSGLLKKMPKIISNGVDIKQFINHNKTIIRNELGIPDNKFVIIVSAANLDSQRKGTKIAIYAIQKMDIKPFVILMGREHKEIQASLAGYEYIETGFLTDEKKLNQYYASANVFLFSSLADNQPLAILESMASGTPVVGFASGGIPEMIVQNETGYLVPTNDFEALVGVLNQVSQDKRYIQWGKNARKYTETYYSSDCFLEKHIELYESLIEKTYD